MAEARESDDLVTIAIDVTAAEKPPLRLRREPVTSRWKRLCWLLHVTPL